ncbi:hypothetical protein [Metapseudomonas otitidis]|uniref:hypothetical protein n=1 Tax=Metapseudomonas otitidis TaxID=319939 RepID=UPI0013F69AD4|nr:hypothetical protein [Pseudomonas otitidis]
MIGAEDLGDFFDPDEFGTTVQLLEAGQPARTVRALEGAPDGSGRLYRSGVDPNASSLRVRPDQVKLQLARGDAPGDWKLTKAVLAGSEYSIANAEPLGRLRVLLTLIPYGDRSAPAGERGKWQASN